MVASKPGFPAICTHVALSVFRAIFIIIATISILSSRGSIRGLATDRRRARQLEIQRKRRRDMNNHARKLALANLEELENASGSAFDVQEKDAVSAAADSATAMSIDLPTSFGGGKAARGRKGRRGRRGENKESRKAFILKHRAKCKFYRSQLMTPEVCDLGCRLSMRRRLLDPVLPYSPIQPFFSG